MTATVGALLDDVHARTWELCARAGEAQDEASQERQAAGLLAAWPRLAAAALRVLDVVRVEPVWLDDAAGVREVLRAIACDRSLAPQSVAGGGVAAASPTCRSWRDASNCSTSRTSGRGATRGSRAGCR